MNAHRAVLTLLGPLGALGPLDGLYGASQEA